MGCCRSLLTLYVDSAGKRPRDLINPKAVKYMQEVFSIKDAISKKESREISAQFGATVTQVIFLSLCLSLAWDNIHALTFTFTLHVFTRIWRHMPSFILITFLQFFLVLILIYF
jgi:hypothetical protein